MWNPVLFNTFLFLQPICKVRSEHTVKNLPQDTGNFVQISGNCVKQDLQVYLLHHIGSVFCISNFSQLNISGFLKYRNNWFYWFFIPMNNFKQSKKYLLPFTILILSHM